MMKRWTLQQHVMVSLTRRNTITVTPFNEETTPLTDVTITHFFLLINAAHTSVDKNTGRKPK